MYSQGLFSETVSTKNHGQVFLEERCYQEAFIVSLNENPPVITTDNHIWTQISFLLSNVIKGFATKLRLLFGVSYQIICDVLMKQQALKDKQYFFCSSAKIHKGFSKLVIVSSLPFISEFYIIHMWFSIKLKTIVLK